MQHGSSKVRIRSLVVRLSTVYHYLVLLGPFPFPKFRLVALPLFILWTEILLGRQSKAAMKYVHSCKCVRSQRVSTNFTYA